MKIGWKLSTLIIIIIVIMNIRFGNSECLATSVKQSTLIESFEAFEKIIVSTSTKNLLTTEKILTTENIAYVSLHNFSKFEFFLENYYPDLCFVIVFLKCQNFHECWAYSQKIGYFESRRLSPIALRSSCSPIIFVIWPKENITGSENNTKHLLTSSAFPSSDFWPSLNSNIYFVVPTTHMRNETIESECIIYDYYSLNSSSLIINDIPIHLVGNIAKTRTNFKEISLRITALNDTSLWYNEHFMESNSKTKRQESSKFVSLVSTGISEEVIDYFQQYLNFRLEVIPAQNWLQLPENNTWIGIGKLLREGLADISVDQSSFIPFRSKYFTLLLPIFEDRVFVYFRQPPASSVRNIFVQPFSSYLWCTIAVTFGFIVCILCALKIVVKFCETNFSDFIFHDLNMLTQNYLLWLTSFITLQGWHQIPKRTWLRIIAFTFSLLGLVLHTAYSATLVSLFASEVIPIKNIEEFVDSHIPLYSDVASPTMNSIFNESLRINDKAKDKKINYISNSDGIKLVLDKSKPSSAFVTHHDVFYIQAKLASPNYATDKYFCKEITEYETLKSPFRAGMIVPKNSSFKEIFNNRIIQLHTSGLLKREQKNYIQIYKPMCDIFKMTAAGAAVKESENDGFGLSLEDTFTAFRLLICGFILSLLVISYEKLCCIG